MGRNGKEPPLPALPVLVPAIFSSHPGEPPVEQIRSGKRGQLGSSRFPSSTEAAARLLVLPVGEGGGFPKGSRSGFPRTVLESPMGTELL